MKWPQVTITVGGKPYLTRYYLLGKDWSFFNIYLHHFHASDQEEEMHNHPWAWAFGIVLKGGYKEYSRFGDMPELDMYTERKPFSIGYLDNNIFHRVELLDEKKGSWSLFVAGPRRHRWGFLNDDNRFRDWTTNPEAIA